MLKLIAFGLSAGAGLQAWRNYPPDGPLTDDSLAVVLLVAVVCAYLGGRWHGRHHASAWASARAEANAEATANSASTSSAQQSVQVAVVLPGHGAGGAMGPRLPSESAPWLAGAGDRAEFSADDFEGMDVAELLPDSTPEAAG